MSRDRGLRILLPASLALASLAAVEGGPTLNHVLRAVPAPGPVAADGDLADWDASGAIVLADDRTAPTRLVQAMAMHAPDGLWLAFRFRDPTPMINHVDPRVAPGRAWCGDGVQLRIGTGPRHGEAPPGPLELLHVDAYWYSDGAQATAHAVYADMSPGGSSHRTIAEAEGAGITSGYRPDPDGRGYVQELRLSWSLLRPAHPVPYVAGESLRLALEPMWGDHRFRDQPAARITDLLDPRLPERQQAWANPRAWGRLEFAARGHLAPDPGARTWEDWCRRFAGTAPAKPATAAPATGAASAPPCRGDDDTGQLINRWFAEGSAAGNRGDAYDNRDRDHSPLDLRRFPQLAAISYGDADRLADRDYGLFLGARTQVVFGNSSTSGPPDGEGCNYRIAALAPAGMHLLHAQYRASNLYIYPAHHDYHPGRNGHGFWGDCIPVNSPYVLLSRGSSGSDQPFLAAAIRTAAAFAPAVRRTLVENGLLMPTIQALLRSTYRVEDASPFAGTRHPAVFEGVRLDEAAMVASAHSMTVADIPPLAQIAVVDETVPHPGADAPAWADSQRLCDTPGAVGRVFRGWGRTMRLTVSAAASRDLQERPLSFRFALLQGDPARVRISPRADGATADLEISWHDRFPVQPGSAIHGNRVDIGVFAGNGRAWSAPAFVSVLCPDHELRSYDERGRLAEIDYAAMDHAIGYETACLLPAGGVPPYDIRDWPELLRRAAGDDTAFGRLCTGDLRPDERAACGALADRLAALLAEPLPAVPAGDIHRRWTVERERAERLSRLLMEPQPGLAMPAKARIEGLLNAWIEDPAWSGDHAAILDPALSGAEAGVRAAVSASRAHLAALGIPCPAGPTRAERALISRCNLAVLTGAVLPGILVREPRALRTDPRLGRTLPVWLAFAYEGDADRPCRVVERPR